MGDKQAIRRFKPEDRSCPILWTAKECPFAERANIAFHELGVEFEAIEVDLKNKPSSLFEVNKKGLVPAMKDQGNCIIESYIILEYIDEMWANADGKALFPRAPAERAIARTWCDYINKELVPTFYQILMKESKEEKEACKAKLLDVLKKIDEGMRNTSNGPFFFGDHFGVVDIMMAPHVERFPALKHFTGFEVPDTDELKRFHAWWKSVEKHPSMQPAKITPEFQIAVYKAYAERTAKSKVADAISKGEPIP